MSSEVIETVVVDGLALAQQLRKEMSEEVGKLVASGQRPPCLAVVLGGTPGGTNPGRSAPPR